MPGPAFGLYYTQGRFFLRYVSGMESRQRPEEHTKTHKTPLHVDTTIFSATVFLPVSTNLCLRNGEMRVLSFLCLQRGVFCFCLETKQRPNWGRSPTTGGGGCGGVFALVWTPPEFFLRIGGKHCLRRSRGDTRAGVLSNSGALGPQRGSGRISACPFFLSFHLTP